MPKKIFLTYANHKFYKSLERISLEAENSRVFDDILCFKLDDLKNETAFWETHGNFIESHERGGGYWLWKPYLVQKVLKTMDEGDMLLYADAGCTLPEDGHENLKHHFEMLNECDGLFFELQHCVEKMWTKMDITSLLDSKEHFESSQIIATTFFIKKTSSILEWCKKWFEVSITNNYHFIDDSPSVLKNVPEFVEHRHDQSILSITVKIMKKTHENIKIFPDYIDKCLPTNPVSGTRLRV